MSTQTLNPIVTVDPSTEQPLERSSLIRRNASMPRSNVQRADIELGVKRRSQNVPKPCTKPQSFCAGVTRNTRS